MGRRGEAGGLPGGDDHRRQRFVVAMSEPDAGSDTAALRTAGQDRGDHFVVNGQKMWCTGAGLPGVLIACYVRTDPAPKHDGLSPAARRPAARGVEVRRTPTLARHILGHLRGLPYDVGSQGQPHRSTERRMAGHAVRHRARAGLISGGYVGVAQATLDEALAYSPSSAAFGRPIGAFQALTHPRRHADRDRRGPPARLPGGVVARHGRRRPWADGQAQGLRDLRGAAPWACRCWPDTASPPRA